MTGMERKEGRKKGRKERPDAVVCACCRGSPRLVLAARTTILTRLMPLVVLASLRGGKPCPTSCLKPSKFLLMWQFPVFALRNILLFDAYFFV